MVVFVFSCCYADEPYKNSIGAGVGMIYGLVGAKLEYSFTEHVSGAAGFGPVPSAGMQFYFRDKDRVWRPRISLYYGWVDALSMERGSDEIVEHFSGASIEIGSRLLFRKNRRRGMDFGLTIPLTDGGEPERRAELEAQGYQTPPGVF